MKLLLGVVVEESRDRQSSEPVMVVVVREISFLTVDHSFTHIVGSHTLFTINIWNHAHTCFIFKQNLSTQKVYTCVLSMNR